MRIVSQDRRANFSADSYDILISSTDSRLIIASPTTGECGYEYSLGKYWSQQKAQLTFDRIASAMARGSAVFYMPLAEE